MIKIKMDLFLKRKKLKPVKALFVLLAFIIFLFSVIIKPVEIDIGFNLKDKAAHFFAYLILAFLGLFSFSRKDKNIGLVFFIIAFCIVYGGLIEIVQLFTGRSCEIYDFLANSAGSFTGAFIAYGILSRKQH